MTALTVGIDIGGTKTAAGLIRRDGRIGSRIEIPTLAPQGGEAVLARAITAARELISRAGGPIEGVGVAAGGEIDPRSGVVLGATDLLPGWQGIEITERFRDTFGLPARAINDAHAAALGEGRFGAARGASDYVMLTLGTGIGGGLVCGGSLLTGALGVAGSIGHFVIERDGRPCTCGSRGCLEAYASGTAIANSALELAEARGLDSSIIRDIRGVPSSGARLLGEAASRGDAFALEVIREAGEYLGVGIASLVNVLNPSLVVVGGSVAALGGLLLEPARDSAEKYALEAAWKAVKVVKSELGNDAGILGAACWVWETI